MKPKMAQKLEVFLCDHCAAVHIGMWRNGQMFAEAIPLDPTEFAAELAKAIEDSRKLQGLPAAPVRH